MAIDNVEVNTNVDVNGNTYTAAISNDKLTNDDFLKLMLEELKMQDPTKPMDANRMLDSQMQMSNIETNITLAKSMESLSQSFSQSALSNAANVIGKNIEDGNINESGVNKAYTVRSVTSADGEVTVTAQEILFLEDMMKDSDGNLVNYNTIGEIINSDGTKSGYKVGLSYPGEIALGENGKPIILDSEDNVVEEELGYELAGGTMPVYSDQLSTVPFSAITKIF